MYKFIHKIINCKLIYCMYSLINWQTSTYILRNVALGYSILYVIFQFTIYRIVQLDGKIEGDTKWYPTKSRHWYYWQHIHTCQIDVFWCICKNGIYQNTSVGIQFGKVLFWVAFSFRELNILDIWYEIYPNANGRCTSPIVFSGYKLYLLYSINLD